MLRAPGALSLLILTLGQRQIPKQTPETEPACATVIVNLTKSNQRQIFLWKRGVLFDGHFVFEERNAPVYLYYVSAFRVWAIGSSIGGTTNVHHTTASLLGSEWASFDALSQAWAENDGLRSFCGTCSSKGVGPYAAPETLPEALPETRRALAVHVVFHFAPQRVKFVRRLLLEARKYLTLFEHGVDVFIHTNSAACPDVAQLDASAREDSRFTIRLVQHDLSTEDPFCLSWKPRRLLATQFFDRTADQTQYRYSAFMQVEDDILVPVAALALWRERKDAVHRAESEQRYTFGFVRAEYDQEGRRMFTDVPKNHMLGEKTIQLDGRWYLLNTMWTFAAMWIYDRAEFGRWLGSQINGSSDAFNPASVNSYGVREKAMVGLHAVTGYGKADGRRWFNASLVPLRANFAGEVGSDLHAEIDGRCAVLHLGNRYATQGRETQSSDKFGHVVWPLAEDEIEHAGVVKHSVALSVSGETYSFSVQVIPWDEARTIDEAESICWRLSLGHPDENHACVLFAFEQLMNAAAAAGLDSIKQRAATQALARMQTVRCVLREHTAPLSAQPLLNELHPPPTNLHLGSGKRLLRGFLNVDTEDELFDFKPAEGSILVVPRVDGKGPPCLYLRQNLSTGLSALANGSIDAIFSEHFIEHIPRSAAVRLFKEIRRLLRPGTGTARVSTPDIELFLRGYASDGTSSFYQRLHKRFASRRLDNPDFPAPPAPGATNGKDGYFGYGPQVRPLAVLNDVFHDFGHAEGHLYDFAELLGLAEEAGFRADRGEIRRASYRSPPSSPLAHLDQWWRGLESLYVELSVSASC